MFWWFVVVGSGVYNLFCVGSIGCRCYVSWIRKWFDLEKYVDWIECVIVCINGWNFCIGYNSWFYGLFDLNWLGNLKRDLWNWVRFCLGDVNDFGWILRERCEFMVLECFKRVNFRFCGNFLKFVSWIVMELVLWIIGICCNS